MTGQPGIAGPVLAHLATGADGAVRELYWRGGARRDPGGGLVLDPGAAADLGTWFNAAPVGWWRAVVGIDTVRILATGRGEMAIHRVTRGSVAAVVTMPLDGSLTIDMPLADADWLWVVLHADGAGGRLDSLAWQAVSTNPLPAAVPAGSLPADSVPAPMPRGGAPGTRVTAVVPTYGRERDALDQVRRLLAPDLVDVVARVVLVDQAGTVRRDPGAAAVMAGAGSRLLLCEQDNLGGSGGYARGMLESLAFADDAVLLLDDDARIDAEGLRRMLTVSTLAAAAGRPAILGTPLLSAERPTHLEAFAEGVRRRDFRWGPVDSIGDGVDVTVTGPGGWAFADPASRADYSGWWGTLLPAGAVARIGLPAPYFLKWDDAEYGLRAGAAGYRVVTLPGTGVWHPTWAAKGTISSWAAWPLHRNRLATAAAYRAGRGVLVDSLVHQVKHVLSLQYQTADLWDAALAQFVSGPDWLSGSLRSTRARAQALLDESAAVSSGSALSAVSAAEVGAAVTEPTGPEGAAAGRSDVVPAESRPGAAGLARRAMAAVIGLGRRNTMAHAVRTAPAAFTWRTGLGRDAVLLDGSDRSLVRDPARARAALRRTVRLHAHAALHWNSLRRRYAVALPESRTEERWRGEIDR